MKKSFRDLDVFNFAVAQAVAIYEITGTFPRPELYGLTAQMRSAAVSVISNIAEGQGRLTPGEWKQFLSQARGSQFEIEAQLMIATRLHYVTDQQSASLGAGIKRTGIALNGLIDYVRNLQRPKSR